MPKNGLNAIELLTAPETCETLGVSMHTLRRWRRLGTGPAFIRLGQNEVRYARADLLRWIADRRVETFVGGDR